MKFFVCICLTIALVTLLQINLARSIGYGYGTYGSTGMWGARHYYYDPLFNLGMFIRYIFEIYTLLTNLFDLGIQNHHHWWLRGRR